MSTPVVDALPEPPAPKPLFSRNATGLVKLGTPYRLMVMNIVNIGITYTAFYFWLQPLNFPRSSIVIALFLTLPFGIGFLLTYALLSIAMPRSGGEYLWLSRAIHPSIGFGVSMLGAVGNAFYVGLGGYWIATLALGPVLSIYGVTQKSSTLVDWGNKLMQTGFPSWPWAFGVGFALATAVLLLAGMRIYYKFQQVVWYLALATFGVGIIVMFTSSSTAFQHAFNQFAAASGGPHHAYSVITAAARAKPTGTSVYDMFGMFALVAYTAVVSAYLGGEVRSPRRSQLVSVVGGGLVYFVFLLVIVAAIAHTPGTSFNADAAWVSGNAPKAYPVTASPTFMLWMSLLGGSSPVLLLLIAIGLVLFSLNWIPTATLQPSRAIFAWGFDRLVPERASAVSSRTGGPTVAVAAIVALAIVLITLYANGVFKYIAPYLAFIVMYGIVCAVAIVFPFLPKSRDIYRGSPADISVAGIPLMTIAGLFGTVFYAVGLYYALDATGLGYNTTANILLTAGTLVVPVVLYFPIRWYRQRQGINLTAATQGLPPD
jgi:amino acid transporter